MYFYVKYQSSLPPIAKRPTDLSDQRTTTDTIRLPYQTYSFTCYPHAIPRLPFSIITKSPNQSIERDYPSERTSLTQHTTRPTTNTRTTPADSIPIEYPTPEQLRHSNLIAVCKKLVKTQINTILAHKLVRAISQESLVQFT